MRHLLTPLLIVAALTTNAQAILHFQTGYGTYNMDDMKALQKNIAAGFPAEAKITSAFPAFLYYEGGLNITVHREIFFGANFGYGSTGGRVMYSDYSGKIVSDQLLHYFSFTASMGLNFALDEKESWFIRGDLRPGFMLTDLKITETDQIGSQSNSDYIKFSSKGFSLQPTVTGIKRLGRLGVELEAGYFISIKPGKLTYEKQKDAYLVGSNNEPLHANWSGIRMALGVCYFFK